jgi:GNAT superfamily N-acetyltransferase
VTVAVAGLSTSTGDAEALVATALRAIGAQRGGAQLLAELLVDAGVRDPSAVAAALAGAGRLLGAFDDSALVGVAALSGGAPPCITGLYVAPVHRRGGVGLSLLRFAASECGARDGWALPGDRATKSLYEKAGWRARRLTMSGD